MHQYIKLKSRVKSPKAIKYDNIFQVFTLISAPVFLVSPGKADMYTRFIG
jgi:hypothetical protein